VVALLEHRGNRGNVLIPSLLFLGSLWLRVVLTIQPLLFLNPQTLGMMTQTSLDFVTHSSRRPPDLLAFFRPAKEYLLDFLFALIPDLPYLHSFQISFFHLSCSINASGQTLQRRFLPINSSMD
jgi:hypothetical protein